MKPIYTVKKDGSIVATFEEKRYAYELRTEKRKELPDSCHIQVEKHILFENLQERNELRS